MIDFLKKNSLLLFVICFVLLLISLWFLFTRSPETITRVRVDTVTTIVTEIKEIQKTDTVVRWYEKPVKEIKVPEYIEVQKVDSVIVIKYKEYDLIINVKKKANKELEIYVVNQEHKVLKKYVYKDVGDVFDITSQENNIKVKSQFLEWNGLGVYAQHSGKFNWKDHNVEAGITTGINWLEKVNLDVNAGYDVNLKDFRLTQKLTYYPLR